MLGLSTTLLKEIMSFGQFGYLYNIYDNNLYLFFCACFLLSLLSTWAECQGAGRLLQV